MYYVFFFIELKIFSNFHYFLTHWFFKRVFLNFLSLENIYLAFNNSFLAHFYPERNNLPDFNLLASQDLLYTSAYDQVCRMFPVCLKVDVTFAGYSGVYMSIGSINKSTYFYFLFVCSNSYLEGYIFCYCDCELYFFFKFC